MRTAWLTPQRKPGENVIERVEIKNFRGIREGKIEGLTPLTIFVGPNGSGKSTVLEAIAIGGARNPSQALLQVMGRRNTPAPWRWLFPSGSADTESRVTAHGSGNRVRDVRLHCEIDSDDAKVLVLGNSVSPGRSVPIEGVVSHSLSNGLRSASGSAINDQFPETILVGAIDFEVETVELFSETVKSGRKDDLSQLIRDLMPRVQEIQILTERLVPVLHLVYPDGSVPLALSGDGTFVLLRMAMELARKTGGTVLLEEPETHLHPAAIGLSARAIVGAVARGVQIVIATHSIEFIDAVVSAMPAADIEKLSVYRTRLEAGGLRSTRNSGSEVAFARGDFQEDLR
jgi:uncharacterized protein